MYIQRANQKLGINQNSQNTYAFENLKSNNFFTKRTSGISSREKLLVKSPSSTEVLTRNMSDE